MNSPTAPRAEAVIDLNAYRHNVSYLADRAGSAELMAVVKADGYGHGAIEVGRAALESGARSLGVAGLDEALQLRAAGITAPVLCWLDPVGTDFVAAHEADVAVSVSSVDALAAVPRGATVHLKIDTGLTRNGCPPSQWPQLLRAARRSGVHVEAMWSNLACADEPGHPSISLQGKSFAEAYDIALDEGLTLRRHIANSAATLNEPDLRFDMCRAGIATYGLNPLPTKENLIPVMTFRSSVVLTKRVPAGEGVSYGHQWITPHETTLALIPVGYADGVPRLLSNRISVWLNGKRRPVRGRICMDQLVVDCGDDVVTPGDEVVLFGTGEHGEPTATEWADTLGTIDYEIVTGMYRPRVRRVYVGEK